MGFQKDIRILLVVAVLVISGLLFQNCGDSYISLKHSSESIVALPPTPEVVTGNGKTLYVNATMGNDATSYENNSVNSPWRTIGRASWGSTNFANPNAGQAAKAGDTVLISAGIYWESGDPNGTRYSVALNPANSGTAESPIVFRGIGLVYVRLNPGVRGAMIGYASARNYIVWDNFQIDDYYGGSREDTGPVVFVGSHHCQLLNSDVQGHSGSYFHGYPTLGRDVLDININGSTTDVIPAGAYITGTEIIGVH